MFKPLFFSTHCHRKHSHKDIFTFFCFLSEDICKIGAAVAGLGEHNCKESHNSIRWEYPNVEMLQWENIKVSKQSNIHMFKHQSELEHDIPILKYKKIEIFQCWWKIPCHIDNWQEGASWDRSQLGENEVDNNNNNNNIVIVVVGNNFRKSLKTTTINASFFTYLFVNSGGIWDREEGQSDIRRNAFSCWKSFWGKQDTLNFKL